MPLQSFRPMLTLSTVFLHGYIKCIFFIIGSNIYTFELKFDFDKSISRAWDCLSDGPSKGLVRYLIFAFQYKSFSSI